jgi:hypothetical protein
MAEATEAVSANEEAQGKGSCASLTPAGSSSCSVSALPPALCHRAQVDATRCNAGPLPRPKTLPWQVMIAMRKREEGYRMYEQDAMVRVQLGKRLEQVIMDKEEATDELDDLKI